MKKLLSLSLLIPSLAMADTVQDRMKIIQEQKSGDPVKMMNFVCKSHFRDFNHFKAVLQEVYEKKLTSPHNTPEQNCKILANLSEK